VLPTAEQKLKERNDPNFLAQVCDFFCYCWESSQVVLMLLDCILELNDLTMTESQEHLMKPFEISANETLKDLFVQLSMISILIKLTNSEMLKMCLPSRTAIPMRVAHCLCSSTVSSVAGV
jgi:hypothetical protein